MATPRYVVLWARTEGLVDAPSINDLELDSWWESETAARTHMRELARSFMEQHGSDLEIQEDTEDNIEYYSPEYEAAIRWVVRALPGLPS